MLCVIALLNQVLERCSRRCLMNGKLEIVFYESVLDAFNMFMFLDEVMVAM